MGEHKEKDDVIAELSTVVRGWMRKPAKDGKPEMLFNTQSGTYTSVSEKHFTIMHRSENVPGIVLSRRVGDPLGLRVWINNIVQSSDEYWIEDHKYCFLRNLKFGDHYQVRYPSEQFDDRIRRACGLDEE